MSSLFGLRWYWSWGWLASAVLVIPICLAFVLYLNFNMLFKEEKGKQVIQSKSDLEIATTDFNGLMMKAQIVLRAASHTVEQMLQDGAPQEMYRVKLLDIDSYFRKTLYMNFVYIYSLINDKYVTSSPWVPPADYLPKERPWYTEAIKGGKKVTLIPPYLDPDSGCIVMSMVTSLHDQKTVVAIDHYFQDVMDKIKIKTDDGIRDWYLVDKTGEVLHRRGSFDTTVNLSDFSNEISKLIENAKLGVTTSAVITKGSKQYTLLYGELIDGWYGITIISHDKLKSVALMALAPNLILSVAVTGLVWLFMLSSLYFMYRGRKKAEEAEHSKTLFFTTVSHDIRTPLNSIIGFSQLLKKDIGNPTIALDYVNDIIVSGNVLAKLINDILDLCKLDANKFQYHYEFSDFRRLVKETMDTFIPLANVKENRLVASIAEDIPRVMIDCQRIRQTLLNLIGNAVKFTDKGTIEVCAKFVRHDSKRGDLIYAVKDTGMGIPKNAINKILNPFVQLGDGSNGTGLGLSICSKLISQMGGTLSIESEVGKGSIFKVVVNGIEYVENDAFIETPTEEIIPEAIIVPGMKNLRFLLVDDIALNLKVLSRMFTTLFNVDCVLALSGEEALKLISKECFDAVFTDIQMPSMDGYQLLDAIRKIKSVDELKVFAVSADVNMLNTWDGVGFSGLMLKPVTFERISKFMQSNFQQVYRFK